VIPADALVYLETDDLGRTLSAITDGEAFARISAKKPDLSAVHGIKLSIAIMGFQTAEQQVTDDQVIGKIIPQFVAVAETNAWSWQATSFAENKLGEFINQIYGGGIELTVTPKDGGKYFVWTAADGRKAYASVHGSVIYFGNDESAIEKCLAVKRGEAESIAKNSKITTGERLAFGYVSPDGVAQIANIAGVSLAIEASEEGEVQSFVARVLPELVRNSVNEITWIATLAKGRIEDNYSITTKAEVAAIFNETITAAGQPDTSLLENLPADLPSVTLYSVRDPQVALRSMLLVAQKQTDPAAGAILNQYQKLLFEPYGIADVEMFLSAVGQTIVTAKLDKDGDKPGVIARVKDRTRVQQSLLDQLQRPKPETGEPEVEVWKTTDGEISAALVGDIIIIGDSDFVAKCIEIDRMTIGTRLEALRKRFFGFKSVPAATTGTDDAVSGSIVELLGESHDVNAGRNAEFLTETEFTRTGIKRRTVADFGLIGTIIAQFAVEESVRNN